MLTSESCWHKTEYLQLGNARQQAAYDALTALGIFDTLATCNPVLVGTIPLDIDITGSDLDVICEVQDLDIFEAALCRLFGQQTGYTCWRNRRHESVVAVFDYAGFRIEIFGQALPIRQQNAYRYMLIEARLLALGYGPLRDTIRRMKQAGIKTEPAFAQVLGLSGDPYLALLAIENRTDDELAELLPADLKL